MTEEGAEPRGGRGAEVVDDKADRGREVGAIERSREAAVAETRLV